MRRKKEQKRFVQYMPNLLKHFAVFYVTSSRAYVNESKSIRLQLFLVLKMNFKRDMSIKEKKSIQS